MNIREIELIWYRENGRYPDRIATAASGEEYVIGDESWNSRHENKNRQEFVESYKA